MLTNVAINAFKPAEKPYKKSDGGGLFLLVQPNGSKIWRFAYRFEGKQKLLSGGPFPQTSIAAARAWRKKMKHQLGLGLDPAVGKFDIAEITPRQMLEALRKIEARGSIEMARRIKNHCSEIFRYAIPDGRCDGDPCRDLGPAMMKPAPVKHRSKIAVKDLPAFYVKLNADGGARLSHLALRWIMLTMVRTQETRFAEWDEFENLDGLEPMWRISPQRMKMRSEHLVPLPKQALDLLDEIRDLNVYRAAGNMRLGRYLFPVPTAKTLVISENRMLDIMYRMGLRGKATVHGFRGLASTVLNETGLFEADWIEHQLAHQPRGVRAAYNSARYLAHRRPMMQWWADFLENAEAEGMRGS